MRPLLVSVTFTVLAVLPIEAQSWSGFRGPNGSAVSQAQDLPKDLGPGQNLHWRVEVPFGRSSPILTRDAVIVTGSDEEHLYVVAIGRDGGEELWTRELPRAHRQEIYTANDPASPTPVTDGENVYVFFPELGLVSLDAEGQERWRHPLGPFVNYYGMSSSPILAGDTLIQLCDQQIGSFLLAVDATTGKERWKVERRGMGESWTTPLVYPAEAPEQVVVCGSLRVHGYSLKDGAELWSMRGFGYAPAPSPTLEGDTLFVCTPDQSAFPMPEFDALLQEHDANADGTITGDELAASHLHFGWLDADKDGVLVRAEYDLSRDGMTSKDYGLAALDLAPPEGPVELWRYRKGMPSISSPLAYQGILYLARDGGLVTLLDAGNGDVLQRGRLPQGTGECFPSPVGADGKVYILSNAGNIAVLEAGSEWSVLGSNDLGEECYATPAIAPDTLYVRTSEAVYSFRVAGS